MVAADGASASAKVLRTVWLAAAVAFWASGAASVARAQEPAAFPAPPSFTPDFDVTEVAFRNVGAFPAPMWTSYALTDALFWGRDNQATNQPLIVSTGDGATLLSAKDLQFPWSEGVRAFYGQRDPNNGGWEIGYFGVYGQSASQFISATPPDFIQMPQPIGSELTADGETATLKYNSVVNSAEANLFLTSTEWRNHSGAWLTLDWLAGFRYVGVEEQAAIDLNCCVVDDTVRAVPYDVRTRNNMFGGQIGSRARLTWQRWALEGWAKAGLLGNSQKQIQDPLIDYLDYQQRPGLSSTGSEVGFIGDLNVSLVYRLTDVWGLRIGYNTVWITGLALAPNQFDFSNTDLSGTRLASSGGMFLNGANLGLEARW